MSEASTMAPTAPGTRYTPPQYLDRHLDRYLGENIMRQSLEGIDMYISCIEPQGLDFLLKFRAFLEEVRIRIILLPPHRGSNTDKNMVTQLAELSSRTEIKISKGSKNGQSNVWIFKYGDKNIAYIGPLNLTWSALFDGADFNVRHIQGRKQSEVQVIERARAKFEQDWAHKDKNIVTIRSGVDDSTDIEGCLLQQEHGIAEDVANDPEFRATLEELGAVQAKLAKVKAASKDRHHRKRAAQSFNGATHIRLEPHTKRPKLENGTGTKTDPLEIFEDAAPTDRMGQDPPSTIDPPNPAQKLIKAQASEELTILLNRADRSGIDKLIRRLPDQSAVAEVLNTDVNWDDDTEGKILCRPLWCALLARDHVSDESLKDLWTEIAKSFLKHGADPNAGINITAPDMKAVINVSDEGEDTKADINASDKGEDAGAKKTVILRRTHPITYLAKRSHVLSDDPVSVELVRLMLKCGADPNLRDGNGKVTLQYLTRDCYYCCDGNPAPTVTSWRLLWEMILRGANPVPWENIGKDFVDFGPCTCVEGLWGRYKNLAPSQRPQTNPSAAVWTPASRLTESQEAHLQNLRDGV